MYRRSGADEKRIDQVVNRKSGLPNESAKVFVSVLDDEAALRSTVRGLDHAAGRFQETMMQKMRLRVTPMLSFHADKTLRKTIKTLELIQQAMDEIEQKATTANADDADDADSDE